MNLPSLCPIRVLVVDDHPVVRDGLRALLTQYPDIEIVGDASDSFTALQSIETLNPHIILLDIKLGNEDGIRLARRIVQERPDARIVLLTSYDDEDYLVEAAKAGVHGYLLKSASPKLLADTIRAVSRGEKCMSPAMADRAFSQVQDLSHELALLRAGLSEVEVEILALVAAGKSVAEIGVDLHFSERTVKRKIHGIIEVLQVHNKTQAVAEAFRRGLL